MTPTLSFYVRGQARPQGSKTAFPIRNRGGDLVRIAMADASGRKGKDWKRAVREAALQAWGETTRPLTGPVAVHFRFDRVRPKAHYGTGKFLARLKDTAPHWPTTQPDALKLARAVEDALSGIVYRDDAQIVTEVIAKTYADFGGVQVDVYSLQLPTVDTEQLALPFDEMTARP